jgi:hypothetical protein
MDCHRERIPKKRHDLGMTTIFLIGLNHTYQYKQAINASQLERVQRQQFTDYVRDVIANFQPAIIADESPDTSNAKLLALYPNSALKVCVDIPFGVKVKSNLMVGRPDGELCPYVDDLREKFWERQLRHAAGTQSQPSQPRILMFCGAQHLYASTLKPVRFIDLLNRRKYATSFVDLRTEAWWDDSWVREWVDPDPLPPCVRRACCVALGADHTNCALQLRYRSLARRQGIR